MGIAFWNRHCAPGILAVLGLGSMFAGCTATFYTSNPEDTVETAVEVARFGHPWSVEKVMAGPALNAFGTREGLAALRDQLSKVTAIEKPQLISRAQGQQGYGHYGDVKRLFSARVSGLTRKGAPASYTAHVVCSVLYQSVHWPAQSRQCLYDGTARRQCDTGADSIDFEGEIEDCRLSNLFPGPVPPRNQTPASPL